MSLFYCQIWPFQLSAIFKVSEYYWFLLLLTSNLFLGEMWIKWRSGLYTLIFNTFFCISEIQLLQLRPISQYHRKSNNRSFFFLILFMVSFSLLYSTYLFVKFGVVRIFMYPIFILFSSFFIFLFTFHYFFFIETCYTGSGADVAKDFRGRGGVI